MQHNEDYVLRVLQDVGLVTRPQIDKAKVQLNGKTNGAGLNGHALNGHAGKGATAKSGILAKPRQARESRASA